MNRLSELQLGEEGIFWEVFYGCRSGLYAKFPQLLLGHGDGTVRRAEFLMLVTAIAGDETCLKVVGRFNMIPRDTKLISGRIRLLLHYPGMRSMMIEDSDRTLNVLLDVINFLASRGFSVLIMFMDLHLGPFHKSTYAKILCWGLRQGYGDMLKYLVDKGAKPLTEAITTAASMGMLDIVTYLVRSNELEFDYQALLEASSKGHLSIVEYLSALYTSNDEDSTR